MDGDDANAVALVQQGDREAFRLLVERHSRAVFRVAYRLTGHEQDAEVEIANGRATETAADLAQLRDRIESQGLIFKVTVLGTQVRQRQQDAAAPQRVRTKSST